MVSDTNGINGSRTNATQTGGSQKGKAADSSPAAQASSKPTASAGNSSQDTVEISSEARVIKSLEAQLSTLPDVNVDKVAEIKAAIDSGEYKIDAESIANKIILSDAEL